MKIGILFIAVGLIFVITGSIIVVAKRSEKPEKKKTTFEDVAAQMDKTRENNDETKKAPQELSIESTKLTEEQIRESKDIAHEAVTSAISESSPEHKPAAHDGNPKQGNGESKAKNNKQSSKQKGNSFEGMVADILKASGIRLLEWNQGTTSPGGAYAENELNPDFLVLQKAGKSELRYWVECKYRSSLPATGFSLEEYQSKRYLKTQRDSKRKVVVVLGVGGLPSAPEKFYIIPIDTISRFKRIGHKYLPNYHLQNPESNFAGHMSSWFFNEVFKKTNKSI